MILVLNKKYIFKLILTLTQVISNFKILYYLSVKMILLKLITVFEILSILESGILL